jgi:hypothetical protein
MTSHCTMQFVPSFPVIIRDAVTRFDELLGRDLREVNCLCHLWTYVTSGPLPKPSNRENVESVFRPKWFG